MIETLDRENATYTGDCIAMICMYVDEVRHRGSGWVGVQHI
jgi:hypothetical protein